MKKKVLFSILGGILIMLTVGCNNNQGDFSGTGTIYRYSEDRLSNGDSIKGISYVTDATSLNRKTYLKHEVEDFNITKTYVCFITDQEYCMESSEDAYETNLNILKENDQWFYEHNGRCIYGSGNIRTYCFGDGYSDIEISTTNISVDGSNDDNCTANSNGKASSCS